MQHRRSRSRARHRRAHCHAHSRASATALAAGPLLDDSGDRLAAPVHTEQIPVASLRG
ncbi:hypothetical protein [Nonomuraea pusilla]|uniref:Uncharacterized protein n=1 Tax=Nonomuraea pusilla TaxID=46177 RepID=A0A1H7YFK6_9ACTN|nr:hypothetical protein [Nonomuraea pusilla]SEM44107.1 hypothetical protein SAMN05660976_05165 [Nonomuraea pusilla]